MTLKIVNDTFSLAEAMDEPGKPYKNIMTFGQANSSSVSDYDDGMGEDSVVALDVHNETQNDCGEIVYHADLTYLSGKMIHHVEEHIRRVHQSLRYSNSREAVKVAEKRKENYQVAGEHGSEQVQEYFTIVVPDTSYRRPFNNKRTGSCILEDDEKTRRTAATSACSSSITSLDSSLSLSSAPLNSSCRSSIRRNKGSFCLAKLMSEMENLYTIKEVASPDNHQGRKQWTGSSYGEPYHRPAQSSSPPVVEWGYFVDTVPMEAQRPQRAAPPSTETKPEQQAPIQQQPSKPRTSPFYRRFLYNERKAAAARDPFAIQNTLIES